MATENQYFLIYAGDSNTINVPVMNNGVPFDLTGCTIEWALKQFGTSPTNLIYKTTLTGITMANPTSGIFTVNLTPSDTKYLCGVYSQGARVTDATGKVTTLEHGPITIEQSVI